MSFLTPNQLHQSIESSIGRWRIISIDNAIKFWLLFSVEICVLEGGHCKFRSLRRHTADTCCWSIYSSTRVRLTSSPVVHTESFQNWSRPMCLPAGSRSQIQLVVTVVHHNKRWCILLKIVQWQDSRALFRIYILLMRMHSFGSTRKANDKERKRVEILFSKPGFVSRCRCRLESVASGRSSGQNCSCAPGESRQRTGKSERSLHGSMTLRSLVFLLFFFQNGVVCQRTRDRALTASCGSTGAPTTASVARSRTAAAAATTTSSAAPTNATTGARQRHPTTTHVDARTRRRTAYSRGPRASATTPRFAGTSTRNGATVWRSTTLAAAPTATISATTTTASPSAAQVGTVTAV